MRKLFCLVMLLVGMMPMMATTISVKTQKANVKVTFYSPDIVRITKTASLDVQPKKSLVVTMKEQTVKVTQKEVGESVVLSTPLLSVHVDKQTGLVSFSAVRQSQGTAPLLLSEKASQLIPIEDGADKGQYQVQQAFSLATDEPIYGLGILQDGKMNRRGTHRYMVQSNLEDFQNVVQSVKGWGVFWDNYSPTHFDDDNNGMQFRSEVGEGVDYYFLYGGSLDQTTALMRTLSGKVPMNPLWTYGFLQSKERYKSLPEMLGVVKKYRELGIPLDGIVQDWQYWGSHYLWNAMDFLGDGFQNAKSYIDGVHQQKAHMLITIWSSFGPQTKGYKQLDEKNRLFNFSTWPQSGIESQWPPRMDYPSGVRCYDPYAQESRDIYWNNLLRLDTLGIDGWWMDSTEPDNFNMAASDLDTKVGDDRSQTFRSLRNAYPLATVGGVYDHQRAFTSDRRVFILTRSGFAGQQRYASNVWSGDIGSSWESLRAQLPAGLNFTLTGNPNFNADIGGFFAGAYNQKSNGGSGARNPQYRELYVRWMQYGLFTPLMRSHGTDVPREFYYYGKAGEPIYDALVKTVKLRYRLLPYIYSTAWQVTSHDDSYMHPLVAEFPADTKTWDMGEEFMFGKSILAAPIVQAQYTSEKIVKTDAMSGWDKKENAEAVSESSVDFTQQKSVAKYLPAGARWYDFWTGKVYDGGQQVTLTTSIDYIPMFVRAGSIVPMGEEMQATADRKWNDLQLKVYSGADASFTLYEDEGDNYNYEKGAYAEIPLTWNEKKHTLTIGRRKGNFKGMLQSRQFTVVLPDGSAKTVKYHGKLLTVKF